MKLQEVNKQTTEEKVQEMSTKMQLEWRRRQVLAEQQGSRPDRDSGEIVDKRVHNQQGFGLLESIKRYIDERLRKVQECMVGLNAITKGYRR
ncbi:MAG: hypothetical protein ACJ71C_12525 [Nitrososphaeraceae archaeon]